ncbi:MAG: 2-enoyl thioester reductase domain-containing protein [Candidatus Methylacidiphilales bacterium]|nr:2-enoyl thioester reductase domain-containing protein [Candidatus Methylacidiphilales bacterium]
MDAATSSALVISRFGDPSEVLELQTRPLPAPGPGELRLRMKFAPINPADLNLIEGTYGIKPPLPAVCGNEGLGVVEAIGAGVTGWSIGDRVIPPGGTGTWQEFALAPADRVFRAPEGTSDEFASMLYVNPPTAWCMLHDFVALQPGDWIIQNAATSAVGRCVIQIARALGWKTLSVVRRPEVIAELTALGGDAVVVEDPALPKRLKEITGGAPIRLALNAVGGDSAGTLAKCLTQGGQLVTYGAMSKQPLKLANGLLIFNDLHCHGFWLTRRYQQRPRFETEVIYDRLGELHRAGQLQIPVEKTFRMAEFQEALRLARQESRGGKVLLSLA